MNDLVTVIAECLHVHALDRIGTDHPEDDPRVDPEFRERVRRQRSNVEASLEGAPELHRRHVASLNAAVRILLRRLAPEPPKPPPPLPVWDDQAKAWRIPDPGQVNTGIATRPFDDRIDDIL